MLTSPPPRAGFPIRARRPNVACTRRRTSSPSASISARRRAAEVEQEVAMLLRDLRVADRAGPRQPAASISCQALVPGRVLEGRAAGAAAQRLRGLALGGDPVHLGADRGGLAGHALEQGLDDDRALGHFAVAIGVAEPLARPGLDARRRAARGSPRSGCRATSRP